MDPTDPTALSATPPEFPDDDIPPSAVHDGSLPGPYLDEVFDFVVVGSGASGAAAAYLLAASGMSVAVVEEGPWIKTRDFGDQVYPAFAKMFRDAGTQMLEGRSYIPLIQGRCVGGSTVVNSAIAWRIPGEVLDDWAEHYGVGDVLSMARLAPHFDALESDLSTRAVTDSALGNNNRLFLLGGAKIGLSPKRMVRYESGCQGSGRCMTGCPSAAKRGMNVTYIPWALRLGARLISSCRVEKVEVVAGKVRAVHGRTASGGQVRLRARRGVMIATSAVQTPGLLRRSGIRNSALGENFQAHPGVGVAGVFDDPVHIEQGATQGAEITELRRTERIKLETISLQPELAVVRLPGVGAELMSRVGQYDRITGFACVIRAESVGRVTTTWTGRDKVTYTIAPRDMERGRKGCILLARMMFEAGAREIWPGIAGFPAVLRSVDEVRTLENAPLDSRAYTMIASHLFGSARMGPDAASSVIGLDFQVHGARGLYVIDSSIFPTNIGVNPQHTIMAIARLAATRALEHRPLS